MKDLLHTLQEIEQAIDESKDWRRDHDDELELKKATAYIGHSNGWRFLLVRWPLTSETWQVRGTATNQSTQTVVHLPPALASKAAHIAEKVSLAEKAQHHHQA